MLSLSELARFCCLCKSENGFCPYVLALVGEVAVRVPFLRTPLRASVWDKRVRAQFCSDDLFT